MKVVTISVLLPHYLLLNSDNMICKNKPLIDEAAPIYTVH